MTPRERLRKAMNGETPDRVPVMCQPSWGHILLNTDISPIDLWHDPQAYAEGLLRIQRAYSFDGILMSVMGFDPDWQKQVKQVRTGENGEAIIRWQDGSSTAFPRDDLPRPDNADPQVKDFESLAPDSIPLEVPSYLPVSSGLRFRVHPDKEVRYRLISLLKDRIGEDLSLHGEVYSPFDYFLDLFGFESSLLHLLSHADKCLEILSLWTQANIRFARELVAAGCDAVKISSPFAGQGFISRSMYVQFIQPFEKQIAQAVRAAGAHVYVHTCGAIDDRLELMRDAGYSGIECLDPPPLGNVRLESAVQRIGRDMFIKGNIDSVNTLLACDVAACKADAIERIRIGRKAKGFILSTACSIAPRVKPENAAVLCEAAEEAGRY